jgi:DNA-binding NarL/FixJ family response regulator
VAPSADWGRAAAGRELEVLIIEDHLSVRKGLELLLRSAGMRIAGVAETESQARALIHRRRHDVALIDLRLGGGDGLAVVHELLACDPAAAAVIYTGATERAVLGQAAAIGVRGLVLKSSPPELLVGALRTVAAGGTFVDPALAGVLAGGSSRRTVDRLSPREREVLELLAEGLNNDGVALRLYLSPETVRTHLRNAMRKLGAKTRVHAVAMFIQHGGDR